MMQDFHNEVKQFLTSEVGQATLKGPLALGVASGALLLSQVIHTASAQFECVSESDCGSGKKCDWVCNKKSKGTCTEWGTRCVSSDS